ncbi:energy transducer TonB [Chryseobacterium caseinilyticum]|uniref:Energy transducer TonB n=1 Tax=Chryseobacterium caseinilyticum TaxID=2771428 RepID=A0ABR8ZD47_9FLAO|nr:energy transducer TonB [Chryseobacterium caseinilyticum]MBD8083224.1 energy transducer TonB [Chryseobacterium caseinilyticum]
MRHLYLMLPFLLIGFKSYAQTGIQSTQNAVAYQKAEFPGGEEVFRKEFMNMVHAYIDSALYRLQGDVTFVFTVGSDGKTKMSEVLPKFKNNELFIDDMSYAVKKIKKKWKPAMKNGLPVESNFVMKVRFGVNSYDHD